MRLVRKVLLALFVLPIVSSCIRETSLDAGETSLVVVECLLANTQVQTLRLSFTKGASREYSPLTEADARLYDVNDGEEKGFFSLTDSDIWALHYEPVPGHTYRLEVRVPGYDVITAEQTMPEINVRAVLYAPFYSDLGLYEYDSYPLIVYEMASLPEYTWIYAMSWDEQKGERKITENLCTDFPFVDNFNLTGEVYDPPVDTVFQWGIENHYALYWPLKGANIHRKYLRVPHPEQVEKNWLIVSGDMKGEFPYEYTTSPLQLINDGIIENPKDGQGYVVFVAVSEDYDSYLMDAIRIQDMQESSDMSSIYVRENICSNIEGGIGLFGAKNEQKLVWRNETSVINE